MYQQQTPPQDLVLTYIHPEGSSKKQGTRAYLDEIVGSGKALPAITVVKDPEDGRLFVYDGNVRTLYANEKGISSIAMTVLTDQKDVSEYLSSNPILWFKIEDFDQLVTYMRAYASASNDGKALPPDIKTVVDQIERERIQEEQRENDAWFREIFGPDDGDDDF